MEAPSKKTGSTPVVEDGIGGGEVLGVVKVEACLVKLRDGHGKEMTKLAIIVPGGEVYFLDEKAVKTQQAQEWVKKHVLKMVKN